MAAQAQGAANVLVLDDSADQRHLIRRYFELAGCDAVVAVSAESAVTACDQLTPDLAVIDPILPGMDGWALTARIQADRPECAVAITSVLDTGDYPTTEAALLKPVPRASVRELPSNTVPKWVAP